MKDFNIFSVSPKISKSLPDTSNSMYNILINKMSQNTIYTLFLYTIICLARPISFRYIQDLICTATILNQKPYT